jgi:DNA-binding MltR family transcriptional regulator
VGNKQQLLKRLIDAESLGPFLEMFRRETDRGFAIGAATVLDSLMEILLRKRMIQAVPTEIFSAYGPLGSFSAKIDISYYLGFISKGDHAELHTIRRIRNEFAHSLDTSLSFSSRPISDHISKLQLSASSILKKKSDKRRDFNTAILVLIGFLYAMIEEASSPSTAKDAVELVLKTRDERSQDPAESSKLSSKPKPKSFKTS